MQIPLKVTDFFTSLSDNKYVILLLINVMLLVLGTLMDMSPLILILTPILLPVVKSMGVDPVHFGMIMMVNLGIGSDHAAGRHGAVRRQRGRQAQDRRRGTRDDAVLRRAVRRADDGDLRALAFDVAAARARSLRR